MNQPISNVPTPATVEVISTFSDGMVALVDWGPERLHEVGHGIQHQDATVRIRQGRQRVDDGREVDPGRQDDLVDLHHVGEHDAERRQRKRHAQREEHREHDRHWKERESGAEGMSQDHHDERQGDQRDEEIHGTGEDRGEHEQAPRDVDLLDDRGVAEEAGSGPAGRLGEEVPQDQRREQEDREVLHGHLQRVREDEGEDEHEEQRVEHGPQHAQHRALVANLQVAGDELPEKTSVAQQLAQVLQHRTVGSKRRGAGQTATARAALNRVATTDRAAARVAWRPEFD